MCGAQRHPPRLPCHCIMCVRDLYLANSYENTRNTDQRIVQFEIVICKLYCIVYSVLCVTMVNAQPQATACKLHTCTVYVTALFSQHTGTSGNTCQSAEAAVLAGAGGGSAEVTEGRRLEDLVGGSTAVQQRASGQALHQSAAAANRLPTAKRQPEHPERFASAATSMNAATQTGGSSGSEPALGLFEGAMR